MRNAEKDEREMSERREQMLETGLRLFGEKGIEAVPMQAVADACGLGIATLYRYFSTKLVFVIAIGTKKWEEFFREMVKEAWADMHARNVQEGLLKEIDRISDEYLQEFQWNATRWSVKSSQKKAANDIRAFLKQRMEWLDTQWS